MRAFAALACSSKNIFSKFENSPLPRRNRNDMQCLPRSTLLQDTFLLPSQIHCHVDFCAQRMRQMLAYPTDPPKWQKNDLVSGGHSQAGSLGGL